MRRRRAAESLRLDWQMYIGVGLLIVRLNLLGLAIAVATISNPLARLG